MRPVPLTGLLRLGALFFRSLRVALGGLCIVASLAACVAVIDSPVAAVTAALVRGAGALLVRGPRTSSWCGGRLGARTGVAAAVGFELVGVPVAAFVRAGVLVLELEAVLPTEVLSCSALAPAMAALLLALLMFDNSMDACLLCSAAGFRKLVVPMLRANDLRCPPKVLAPLWAPGGSRESCEVVSPAAPE